LPRVGKSARPQTHLNTYWELRYLLFIIYYCNGEIEAEGTVCWSHGRN